MQLTIPLPDILPDEISRVIKKVKEIFTQEGIVAEITPEPLSTDAWDSLNFDEIAVDTGRVDFAENHDHYLYGIAKRL
ncbi:MAG: hypothetical protein WCL46_09195 [Chlorobium sp.]